MNVFHQMNEFQPNKLLPESDQAFAYWQAFTEGNEEALGSLFRLYYTQLYKYGCKICPNTIILEDCIQELFLQLWQKKTPVPVTSVKAYLLKALKYKLLKAMQQKSNKPVEDSDAFEISHEHFLINRQHNEEKVKKVIDALALLTTRQKEIIYLKFYQNLSYEEVSEIMNISYQTARNLLHKGVSAMKKILMQSYCLMLSSMF